VGDVANAHPARIAEGEDGQPRGWLPPQKSMNVFVPLLIVVVAVCWFLVYTGRVAPTDPWLLLFVGGAMASGAVFFLYAYARAGRGSYTETVVCARVPGAGLPRFALAPKGFWPWLSIRGRGRPTRLLPPRRLAPARTLPPLH
jgi:hypothetical protein